MPPKGNLVRSTRFDSDAPKGVNHKSTLTLARTQTLTTVNLSPSYNCCRNMLLPSYKTRTTGSLLIQMALLSRHHRCKPGTGLVVPRDQDRDQDGDDGSRKWTSFNGIPLRTCKAERDTSTTRIPSKYRIWNEGHVPK